MATGQTIMVAMVSTEHMDRMDQMEAMVDMTYWRSRIATGARGWRMASVRPGQQEETASMATGVALAAMAASWAWLCRTSLRWPCQLDEVRPTTTTTTTATATATATATTTNKVCPTHGVWRTDGWLPWARP